MYNDCVFRFSWLSDSKGIICKGAEFSCFNTFPPFSISLSLELDCLGIMPACDGYELFCGVVHRIVKDGIHDGVTFFKM